MALTQLLLCVVRVFQAAKATVRSPINTTTPRLF